MLPLLVWLLAGPIGAAQDPAPGEFFTSTFAPEELRDKQAVIETTAGVLVLDLLDEAAPNHVAHFVTEARDGAYDGTTFHRVVAMGIIQGGDPLSVDPDAADRYGSEGNGPRFEEVFSQVRRAGICEGQRNPDFRFPSYNRRRGFST